ncbi:unnamed protein product [Lactuca saligna]|uniref:Uncharacterized protein n=1 Tax=Lactuca saligna TaxID=75948 RepID=A0AA35Z963_LACSI|nr:unnamed protein product [Lactuca saligna]
MGVVEHLHLYGAKGRAQSPVVIKTACNLNSMRYQREVEYDKTIRLWEVLNTFIYTEPREHLFPLYVFFYPHVLFLFCFTVSLPNRLLISVYTHGIDFIEKVVDCHRLTPPLILGLMKELCRWWRFPTTIRLEKRIEGDLLFEIEENVGSETSRGFDNPI